MLVEVSLHVFSVYFFFFQEEAGKGVGERSGGLEEWIRGHRWAGFYPVVPAGIKQGGRQAWATAKGFDRSAPCSDLHKVEEVGHIERGKITLSVNGEIRQQGDIPDMIGLLQKLFQAFQVFLNCVQET